MHALVLAMALSPSPIEEWVERAEKEMMLPNLRSYWIAMGIMEDSEWYFQAVWAIERDTQEMMWRMENVPSDAPPLDYTLSLPDYQLALSHYLMGQRYAEAAKGVRIWLIQGPETVLLDTVLEEARWRSEVWQMIYWCGCGYNGPHGRRMTLCRLRELVGKENFEKGKWPDPLPAGAYLYDWDEPQQQYGP